MAPFESEMRQINPPAICASECTPTFQLMCPVNGLQQSVNAGRFPPAIQAVQTAAVKAQTSNNLKQMGLGMHNYSATNGTRGIDPNPKMPCARTIVCVAMCSSSTADLLQLLSLDFRTPMWVMGAVEPARRESTGCGKHCRGAR